MLDQTDAFKNLKVEQQRILDFSKLVCYSVPNLKKSIKGYKERVPNYETIVKPDYFIEDIDIDKLSLLSHHYQNNLSKYILISAFSFFESYFRSVVKELELFHGGADNMILNMMSKRDKMQQSFGPDAYIAKRNLQTRYKKRKWEKYKKQISKLDDDKNYRHPNELFSPLGIKFFFETVSSTSFKSVLIPELLEVGLGLDLNEKINKHPDLVDKNLKETFHAMRDLRNSIGHGGSSTLSLDKTMDLIRFLRFFSVKIDNHLIKHYFVIQNYK